MNAHDSINKFGLTGMSLKMANHMTNGYADDRCPVCDEYNEGYNDLEFFNGSEGCGIWLRCSCPECGSKWTLEYKLDFAYIMYDGLADNEEG